MTMNRFADGRKAHLRLGKFGEDTAVRLLKIKGYHILARNFKLKSGELDIVALDGATVVFVEVKTRRQNRFYAPGANLSFRQMKRNFNTGKIYLSLFNIPEAACRFDLIEVTVARTSARKILSLIHSTNILMHR
jgi:putative endonuclease